MKVILLIGLLLLSGCSFLEKTLDLVITTENPIIAKAAMPTPVQLHDVKFRVITEENIDAFLKELDEHGGIVFIAMRVEDYETLALNVNELRKYIKKLRAVVVYYEEAILPVEEEEDVE